MLTGSESRPETTSWPYLYQMKLEIFRQWLWHSWQNSRLWDPEDLLLTFNNRQKCSKSSGTSPFKKWANPCLFSFIFVRSRQCFVSNDPFPASFSLFSSSQHSFNTVEVYTICWWLDSNHGSLLLVVTALTSVPQTPRFERSHRQSIILFICLLSTVRKRQKWIKRCRDGPFKKIDFQFELW